MYINTITLKPVILICIHSQKHKFTKIYFSYENNFVLTRNLTRNPNNRFLCEENMYDIWTAFGLQGNNYLNNKAFYEYTCDNYTCHSSD